MTAEPTLKPERPFFSSGPTAKHKGWSAANLKTESLGRSHRSALGKSRLKYAIDLSKEMLGVPEDYLVGSHARIGYGRARMRRPCCAPTARLPLPRGKASATSDPGCGQAACCPS